MCISSASKERLSFQSHFGLILMVWMKNLRYVA